METAQANARHGAAQVLAKMWRNQSSQKWRKVPKIPLKRRQPPKGGRQSSDAIARAVQPEVYTKREICQLFSKRL